VAHLWLELLAYAVGAQWYRLNLRRSSPSVASPDLLQRWAVIAGAVFGAAVGSKLLYVLQYLPALMAEPAVAWWSGKTIAGGLLGGVRFAGDELVVPLHLAGVGIDSERTVRVERVAVRASRDARPGFRLSYRPIDEIRRRVVATRDPGVAAGAQLQR
jgi:hypothetical protein